jgi:hypothetical protein
MRIPLLPARGVLRVQLAHLGVGQTLGEAPGKLRFAQNRAEGARQLRAVPRCCCDRQRRRRGRAAQVAAIHRGQFLAVGQRLAGPLRLPAAARVQTNVQLAL